MKSRPLADSEKSFALVMNTGDEVLPALLEFARTNECGASHFTGIGAFSRVVLGYFDWETKDYVRIPVSEQVEVISLLGDIALEKGEPKVHAHIVVGKRDGTTMGGHLLEGTVRPTLEIVLEESPSPLRREYDPQSGLALIRL
ncbi:MAG TPA: PPC domain-containing DNA-binding protein [Candidatus Acidoferrales bacterium]|nr:PPC domain-containing DNA-binding protein [Candidatus Acidoferrales bacterium]